MTWLAFYRAANLTCCPAVLANGVAARFDEAYDGTACGRLMEGLGNRSHNVISALSLDNLSSRAGERPFLDVYVVAGVTVPEAKQPSPDTFGPTRGS